jgi:hypothetical protein
MITKKEYKKAKKIVKGYKKQLELQNVSHCLPEDEDTTIYIDLETKHPKLLIVTAGVVGAVWLVVVVLLPAIQNTKFSCG